jgi:hypothetical protein
MGGTPFVEYGYCAFTMQNSSSSERGSWRRGVAISGNTNSNVATNGRSLHTRRHWFAAKNPSWRSRTRSWTPHGTPPKGAAAHRVLNKRTQARGL